MRKEEMLFMFNMKDSEKHRQSNNVTKNLHPQNPATKRHMKAIHGDQLGLTSGYNGVMMTDTKQQIFSDT